MLTDDFGAGLLLFALCAARVLPVLLIAPFFGGRLVPSAVKIGIAGAVALLVLPHAVAEAPPGGLAPVRAVVLLGKEVVVGVALGFAASLIFFAAEAAGRLIDHSRGVTLAESLAPQTGARVSPVADLFLQLGVVIFVSLGGHRLFLGALGRSYEVLPVTALPSTAGLGELALVTVAMTGQLMAVAVGLATPVLLAALLADLTLGLVGRVAPQVNAWLLGLPAKALLGAAVLLLTITAVAREVGPDGAVADTLRALEALTQ